MAYNVLECKICLENYDSKDHKPLCLDCGHTFCQTCVRQLLSSTPKACATCRKSTSKSIDQIPVVYSLVPSNENAHSNSTKALDKCAAHGCVLDHFCADCGVTVCRKCVRGAHSAHDFEFIDDILTMDPDAAVLTKELKNKIEAKISSLARPMSVSLNLSEIIDKLLSCKNGIEKWTDSLSIQMQLLQKELEAWSAAKQKSPEEKQKLFKKLCLHWKGNVSSALPTKDLSSFLENIKVLNEYAALLEESVKEVEYASKRDTLVNTGKLYTTDEIWHVRSEVESQISVASVHAGRTPRSLDVVTSPAAPIRQLPQVLDILGSACTGAWISVRQLDIFWEATNTALPGRLLAFVEKFGYKVCEFYGLPREAVALCRVNPAVYVLGVRLASMEDIEQCSAASEKIRTVSCIRGLPAAAGDRMLQLKWLPWKWHFPNLQAGEVRWMVALMKLVLTAMHPYCTIYIYLPRCCLRAEDFLLLLETFSRRSVYVYCDHASLSALAKSRLEEMGAKDGSQINFQWTIPL